MARYIESPNVPTRRSEAVALYRAIWSIWLTGNHCSNFHQNSLQTRRVRPLHSILSKVCYVYLYDVDKARANFENSSWFSRGWTLQELLAPPKLHFFDHDWAPIGSRRKLTPRIEKITRIPRKAIYNFSTTDYCVAEKMSWTASRTTTRQEDRAYCLLGLFNVNMPLLYGERVRAFQRLQEEIMKVSIDMSLFLWHGRACDTFGMLASDPNCFSDTPHILQHPNFATNVFVLSKGWSINNGGLSISASIRPHILTDDLEGVFALYLHETFTYENSAGCVIFLQRVDTHRGTHSYQRVVVNGSSWARLGWTALTTASTRYLPSEFEVSQLFITRRPLIELECSGTRGFTLKFTSHTPVQCAARSRPVDKPEASLTGQ